MKKMTMVLAVAIIVAIAGSAFAFNVPTSGSSLEREVKKEGTRMATTAAANSQLKKYKCEWDTKANVIKPGCDLVAIGSILKGQNEVCKQGGASCYLSVNTSNSSLYNYINKNLRMTGEWRIKNSPGSDRVATFSSE